MDISHPMQSDNMLIPVEQKQSCFLGGVQYPLHHKYRMSHDTWKGDRFGRITEASVTNHGYACAHYWTHGHNGSQPVSKTWLHGYSLFMLDMTAFMIRLRNLPVVGTYLCGLKISILGMQFGSRVQSHHPCIAR